MLLYNAQIPLIKVNKNLNNTKIYTHIRSQTNNQLKLNKTKKKEIYNNQSLSQIKQKKIQKLTINTNNSLYVKKNLNFSRNKCSNNRSYNIPPLITETTNVSEYNENNENIYNKTLSNLTHIKLHSQNIFTQKNENKKEKENTVEKKCLGNDYDCKKYMSKYLKYKNKVERSRSGKKIGTEKTSPASSIVSSFDEKNSFNNNLEEKKLKEILQSTKFNNNNQISDKKELKIVRSIRDIKKECLATMKISEKVQSRINNEGNKLINSLKEKYLKLTAKEENCCSDISSTFSTPCEPNKHLLSNSNFFQLQENINNINLGFFSLNYNNLFENKNLYNNNFSIEEYNNLIDTIAILEYGPSILEEYFLEEEYLKNILINHSITPYMRMKMVDWMVEIFTTIPTKEITFFICVNIMDRFFYYSKKEYKADDLHLIGICSIFLAFKYSETNPLKMDFLVEKIAHNKFKKKEIIEMEQKILTALNFNLLKPTLYEFAMFYFRNVFYRIENFYNIKNINLKNSLKEYIDNYNLDLFEHKELLLIDKYYNNWIMIEKYSENMRNYVKSIAIYLLMMCAQDYEIICEKKPLVAGAIIFVSIKICEEVNKEKYIDDYLIEKLKHLTKENQYNIMEMASRILKRIQNYEKYYPGINNFYNIYFQKLSQMKDTK